MRLFGDRTVQLNTTFKKVQHRAHQRLGLSVSRRRFDDNACAHFDVRLEPQKFHDLYAPASLHQCRARTIRHVEQTPHRHLHTDGQKIFGIRIVHIRVALRQPDNRLFFLLRILQRQQRRLAPDKDRRDHARKNHHIPQRQHHRLDQTIRFWLHVRDAVQFLCPLGKRQVEIIFFSPVWLTHSKTSILSSLPRSRTSNQRITQCYHLLTTIPAPAAGLP